MFKDRMRILPQSADDLKAMAQEGLRWLDALMEGQDYVCGDRFSLADILLAVFLEFGGQVGQPMNPAHANIAAWHGRVKDRPCFSA